MLGFTNHTSSIALNLADSPSLREGAHRRVRLGASLVFMCTLMLSLMFSVSQREASAQGCNMSDNVSFIWTSPPNVDVLSNDSARWGTDGSLRFSFVGDWCPIPEDVSFEDEDGNPDFRNMFGANPRKTKSLCICAHR